MWRNKHDNSELIKTFPEAKGIIPLKIKEWEEIRNIMLKSIKEKTNKSNEIPDETDRFIFREIIKIWEVEELLKVEKHIERLKRISTISKWKKLSGHISEKQKKEALQVPIKSLYNRPLQKSGTDFIGLCPFHKEKKPSFHIYTKTNSFYCFGCGKGGNVINFIRILHGYSFPQAVNHLLKNNYYD